MAPENETKIDYAAIIADLEAKKAAIDTAIAGLRAAMSAFGTTEGASFVRLDAAVVNPSIHGGEVPAGAFLGKSIPESARLYLSIVKAKKTTREVSDALRRGGMETTSTNFENIVHAGLNRAMKNSGAFLRVGKAWALPEWYPAGMRVTQDKRENRKPQKTKRKRLEKQESSVPVLPIKRGPDRPPTEGHHPAKLRERVVAFINEHPNEQFTSQQLSEKFGIHAKVISMTLAKPLKQELIKLVGPSTYAAGGAKRSQ
jgi:hypothetical protein